MPLQPIGHTTPFRTTLMKTLLIGGWGYQSSLLKPLIDAAPEGTEILPFALGDLYELGKTSQDSGCVFQAGLKQVLQFFTEPVTLIGWSTGAMIAYACALENANIEKLVLISPCGAFVQSESAPYGTPKVALLAMKKAARRDALSMLWKFDEKVFHPMEKVQSDAHEAHFEQRSEVLGAGLDYLIKTNLLNESINRPLVTKLIHGQQDAIIPVEAGQALAEVLKVELNIIDDAGHGLPLTHPEQIWQIATA